MTKYRGLLDLADELLLLIVDYLAADPDTSLTVDKRAYLSQESFRSPSPPPRDQRKDVDNFRKTCRKLLAIGARQQYGRITTRFSKSGLKRLDGISDFPELAEHVKKFSYMVPCFYEDRQNTQALAPMVQQTVGNLDIDVELFKHRVQQQREIVRSGEDVRILKKALSAFVNLQHIQILRVQDREDDKLLALSRHHDNMALPFIQLNWAPACLHSTKTIGAALLASQSTCSRFSSPMLSPQSAIVLAANPPSSFATLAERLTCLELHFDDGQDLDMKMQELSSLFNIVFTAAVNMEAVHIGFPALRPLNLPLEMIFHNVQWKKLIAFGVQGWKLDAEEIIDLARRHRERLKGLRLRDVLLKDGSMWKDILGFLRSDMHRLDWVSLRRIGYARKFDEHWANPGIEIPDDFPGGASGSETEDEDDENSDDTESSGYGDVDGDENGDNDDFGSGHTSESEHEDTDDEHGPAAHELQFPSRLNSPDTPNSITWCNCHGQSYPESVEDLGDDGTFVDNTKRKLWEKWVLGRCPEHDVRY